MRLIEVAKRHGVGMIILLSLCLPGSGCQAILDGIGEKVDYDSSVDYYQGHGMNQRDAERNAYEDQIWDSMGK